MTEGHESDFLVTVRAQVMTRDESTEGWLPLAGGGLANVSIRKRARLSPGAAGHEYIIYGQRISDQSVILSCVINRDLKYYKVMPTFHHWRAGKQRNGLTFQTAADARAFDKGVLRAYNELIDGLAKSNPSIICPPLTKYDSVGEDDVFMTLDLPVETESIQKVHSSPEGSEKSHTSLSSLSFFRRAESLSDRGERLYQDTNSQKSDSNEQHKPTIHYISSDKSPSSLQKQQQPLTTATLQQQQQQQTSTVAVQTTAAPVSVSSSVGSAATTATTVTSLATQQSQQNITSIDPPTTIAPSENYSYVTLTAVHDYNYPVVDQPATAQVLSVRRESITALKKQNALAAAQQLAAVHQQTATPLTAAILKDPNADLLKKHQQQRVRCRYCNELFHEDFNRKGACEFAPDCFRNAIECISGMGCARCMLYHCLSDDEGETPLNPCDCINEDGCTKRWIGLTLLSFFVPCLWCYPPLRACHWIGVSCGVCGGKHKPQD